MTAKELLLECKIKLKIESDYALAKALEMPTARLSEYMRGKVHPDVYGLTRIAMTLNRDPIELIAEYESTNEKNPIKKAFWESFTLRAGKVKKACTLALIFISFLLIGLNAAENPVGFFRRRNFA